MRLSVTDKYMIIPVGFEATCKKLSFFSDEKYILELDTRLDYRYPDARYYADMSEWVGKTLDMVCEPEVAFSPCFVASIPDDKVAGEKYRPRAHFSARRGWINDPNGLFYYNGQYHLFYQHNPYGRDWGNMHWGHAISTDLMHWTELGVALLPDENGMVFSGSAYVDRENISGLGNGKEPPILLYYTAGGGYSKMSQGHRFTQAMAYSTDGGSVFHHYKNNPVVGHLFEDNRDPKVVRDPVTGLFYMALYLGNNRFMLLTSHDLCKWSRGQELILSNDMECPDIYRLPIENENGSCWIFTGANGRYLIGQLDNGFFTITEPVRRLHYGKGCYAAQTFANLDLAQKRTVRMAWNRSIIPASCFVGAMCTPTEMTLRRIQGDLMLCTMPVREISKLYRDVQQFDPFEINSNKKVDYSLNAEAQDIVLEVYARESPNFTLDLLGTQISIIPSMNRLELGEDTMPLCVNDDIIRLRIITDTNSLEIYADQGEAFLCSGHINDYTLNRLSIRNGDGILKVDKLCIASLAFCKD